MSISRPSSPSRFLHRSLLLPPASQGSARSTPRRNTDYGGGGHWNLYGFFSFSEFRRHRYTLVLRNYLPAFFFLYASSIFGRISERERDEWRSEREGDSTRSNFSLLYGTIRFFGEKDLQIKRQCTLHIYTFLYVTVIERGMIGMIVLKYNDIIQIYYFDIIHWRYDVPLLKEHHTRKLTFTIHKNSVCSYATLQRCANSNLRLLE